MEPRPPSHSHSVLTRWMGVGEANSAGNVHGGWIMKLCDEVAGIAAIRHSGHRVVTAAMDRMNFRHPSFPAILLWGDRTTPGQDGALLCHCASTPSLSTFPPSAHDRRSGS